MSRKQEALTLLADEFGFQDESGVSGSNALAQWARFKRWRDGNFQVEWGVLNGQRIVLTGDERGTGTMGPLFSPTQLRFVNDRTAKYILLHGERGSGKTFAALCKQAIHCYEEKSALGLIIVQVTSMAEEGGAWHKLLHDVFPILTEYAGIERSDPKFTATSKKPYIWVFNRHGSSSRCTLLSMPNDANVKDRIKGIEASNVVVDEAQVLPTDTYFSDVVQQVGRRPRISSQQQVVYCANPAGPSHWLYKRFFEMPAEDGVWNNNYLVLHVPIDENLDRLPQGYYDTVIEAVRGDEVEMARMVRGEWVDRPSGDAIFRDVWVVERHFIGETAKNIGILPVKGYTIIAGYDLGPAHSSVHYLQHLPVEGSLVWVVFDEINSVGMRVAYQELVPQMVDRMDYWENLLGGVVYWDHIADDSAFNQLRTDGSFDNRTVQDLSNRRILMRPAPKGPGSVAERVRTVTELLRADALLVSAICIKTKQMFESLASPPARPGVYDPEAGLKPVRSAHLHSFDSLSYPIITVRMGGARARVGKVMPGTSSIVRMGAG